MAEFRLGRLKFNWRGAWVASTAYVIDDIVKYGASSYVCTVNHTSDSSSTGFPNDSAYWSLHLTGQNFAGDLTVSTGYVVQDIVKEGGNLYICTAQNTSTGIQSNWYANDYPQYWDIYAEGVNFRGAFATDTYYGINDVVEYGPQLYRVTSPFQTPSDQTATGVSTSPHDTTGVGSDGFFPPASNFAPFSNGIEGKGEYDSNARYERGDLVEFSGSAYVAIGTNPRGDQPNQNPALWSNLVQGIGTGAGATYDKTRQYGKGEIVTYGGNSYIADQLIINNDTPPIGAGITDSDAGQNGWSLLVRGQKWRGTWSNSNYYEQGDLVEYSSSAYVSVASSNLNVQPGTAVTMWQAFAIGDSAALLTTKGDILTRDGTGPSRQGIGTQGTFLRVSSTDEVEWQYAGQRTKIYFIDAQQGSNDNSGLTPDDAWQNISYASTAAQKVSNITNFVYDNTSGIATVTAANHGLFPRGDIRLAGISFTCAPGFSGLTTTIYPDGTQGFYFKVDSVIDSDTFVTNVSISTIAHTYVSGGTVTDSSPVIIKLSAGVFSEELPITLPKNFSIAGDVLRGSTIQPAPGISTEGVIPNARQTMFFVSDSTTVQAITMRGLQGFDYDTNDPFNTDKWQVKTGVGTTSCGVYFRLNPTDPILNRSPYIKDCTAFSDVCLDGTGHQGAIGIFIEGGVHNLAPEGAGGKSMVFDAFTNIHSGGVGFFLEDDALAEIVSSFTYYCAFGYVSDDGSEIRSLSGNNSYGTYGAVAAGFSTLETPRFGRMFGDKMTTVVGTYVGTLAVGATMRGTVSGARGTLTNDQSASDAIYFKYKTGFGNTFMDAADINPAVGIGTTVFTPGEFIEVDSVGAGATGYFRLGSGSNAVNGQQDILFEVAGLSTTPIVGDALGFTTVGMGFSDTNTYILRAVTNYVAGNNFTPSAGSYNPSTGIVQLTSNGHGMMVGDKIQLTPNSLTFTCSLDGNVSQKTYPRATGTGVNAGKADPLHRTLVALSATTVNTFSFQSLENIPSTNTSAHTFVSAATNAVQQANGRATINVAPGKGSAPKSFDNQEFAMRSKFSKLRLTGHDFLLIGTGNTAQTNYPNTDENTASQGNETNVVNSGKIFFVSTDQGGNFRVGEYFSVNQLTGAATLDASAFNLSGLTELRLGAIGGQIGEAINEFSSDELMSGDSNQACPTEKAVRGFLTRGKMDATSGILVPPRGSQAGRPTGNALLEGGLRYDTDTNGYEYYNGSSWLPVGAYQSIDASSGVTAANKQQIFCNTSGGGFTVTLPGSPTKGDSIRFFDVAKTFDSNALTVGRNGNPIMGDASDLTVNTEGAAFELVFYDGTQGWRIITI